MAAYSQSQTNELPSVREALRQLDAGTILDGEVVAFDEAGSPSFAPGPHGIDAIAVGYYEGDRLIFVARTRNGFEPSSRRSLFERLKPLITKKCPFANLPEPRSYRWGEGLTEEKMAACVWVKPEIVAQINYVNWTDANHLRHSSFVGIREDKRARDVFKEHAGES